MLTQLLSHWSTITFTDLLTAAYLVFLVIFVFGCNYLFTNFVDSKPEGRKTVLAKVNVEISRTSAIVTAIVYFPILLRILLGPFHLSLVIGFYYLQRLLFTFVMNQLTFKTLLMSAFIVYFEFVSGFSDSAVLATFNALSTVTTVAGVIVEVSVKMLNGSEHIGASSFSIFLGAKSEDLTR